MANYSSLIAAVNAAITANGTGAITGPVLNTVLQQMIVSLGQGGYLFKGRAIPTTDPGSPDQNVFYIATTPGTYTNFSSIVVAAGECAILKGSGTSWSKEATGIDLVSVSQNSQTGHTDITVGDTTTPVASAEEVSQLGQEIDENSNAINTIFVGQLQWLTDKYYDGGTGVLVDGHSLNYVCSLKYPKVTYDDLLDVIDWALANWDWTQISFWKNGAYAGSRVQAGYKLPDGTIVASIEFDTFAINIRSTDIPDYQTQFVIPSLTSIPTITNEIGEINQKIGGNIQIIDSILSSGQLVWHDGVCYDTSTGVIRTIATYSCSDKYLQHFYSFISDKIEELFVASDWTIVSFWKDGVYAGYRLQNGYYLPDGTLVDSIDYDEFAINLNNSVISDYRTRVVFVNIDGAVFQRGFFALGDSTTAGAGSSQSPAKSWANYLTELAIFPSFTNLAINGAFCLYHEGYGRLSAEIDSVPANATGIVTIMIGTNDFFNDSPLGDAATALASNYADLDDTTTFANAFRYCLEKLKRKAPNAVIVVMQPLPSFDAGNVYGHLDETGLFAIRDIERTICNAMGIPIVESQYIFGLSRYTDNWNIFFNDFCHPNDVGYQRIAHCMLGKFIEFCQ